VAALGYIEVLDGKGNVIERSAVEAFPVHVGRAYTNHLIVNDPFVCPMHLTIELDALGRLTARDLASVNGLRDGVSGARVASLEIHSGTQLRIGRTLLRYCSADHPLAPTLIDRSDKTSRWVSPYAAVAAGVIALAVLCTESYLSSIERVSLLNIVGEPLTIVATMLGWAGLWALASRLIVGRFWFAPHAIFVFAAFLSMSILSFIAEWSEFLFPVLPMIWLMGVIGYAVCFAGLLYGNLTFASPLRGRTRLWAALAVSLAMVGINNIGYFAARSKFSTVMEYSGALKPLDAALLPATSVDQFIGASQNLQTELERLAQKAKSAQP
jgi:hypothetical protein